MSLARDMRKEKKSLGGNNLVLQGAHPKGCAQARLDLTNSQNML